MLVNNAGVEEWCDYAAGSKSSIDWQINVNLTVMHLTHCLPSTVCPQLTPETLQGLMHLTHNVLPGMLRRGKGHVVSIASLAGHMPVAYGAVYAATKHGVRGFSNSLRLECASRGVTSHVICPGFIAEVSFCSCCSALLLLLGVLALSFPTLSY